MWWIPLAIGAAWLANEILSDDSSSSSSESHDAYEAERRRQKREAEKIREQNEAKQREIHCSVTMKSLQGELSNLCQQHEVPSVDISDLLTDSESIISQQQKTSRKNNQRELDNVTVRIRVLESLRSSLN